MAGRRLIEVDFPIRAVSEASGREKSTRHGHISTLHIWWARRPLAASRATALAALIPDPDDDTRRKELLRLVQDIAPWEVVKEPDHPKHRALLERARTLIREAHGGRAPRVLDCFAGGGAIPLEALRLGCETYALDYNPVAVLILKAVLEYPQKFGRPGEIVLPEIRKNPEGATHEALYVTQEAPVSGGRKRVSNMLLAAVQAWGRWILEEARKELERFYPKDPDGSIPVGYIWARTLPCPNPACGAEIPLMRQFWLAKKPKKKLALKPLVRDQTVTFEIETLPSNWKCKRRNCDCRVCLGTVKRAKVRCLVCGGTIDDDTTRRLFREGKAGQRMVSVVLHHPHRRGKTYRLPTERDLAAYREAEAALEAKRQALWAEWGMDPVPNEPTPIGGGPGAERAFSVHKYGMTRWGDLFNARQKLALITFAEKVRQAHTNMLDQGYPEDCARAMSTYLGLMIDKLAGSNNTLTRWQPNGEKIADVYSRQSLPIVWDYVEPNQLDGKSRSWEELHKDIEANIEYASPAITKISMDTMDEHGLFKETHRSPPNTRIYIFHASATQLPYPDEHFDAVLTDPPYYDNVPYSDLSDFFYVWLKRTIGDLYPELFATPLTPKSEEMVADASKAGSMEAAKARFESMLTQAFREIYRVLKPDGIAVIVFAHKTTAAWESVIQALLNAGLYMTASWPIHTEMQARLRAQESAALASSIYMVCRKRTTDVVGEYAVVRREIEERIQQKLQQFWDEGIRGADFFMSAIGPAVEVFGRYARVEKLSGEPVTVAELLEYVRRVVSRFALERILKDTGTLGGVDPLTRFYVLYRWAYNHKKIHFDEVRKLAQSVGIEVTAHWGTGGLIQKDKEYIRVKGPVERAKDRAFLRRDRFETMIDALHYALILWSQNETTRLKEHLASTYGGQEAFWQVAQAIVEVLPDGDREKQWLQGLLYGHRPSRGGPPLQTLPGIES